MLFRIRYHIWTDIIYLVRTDVPNCSCKILYLNLTVAAADICCKNIAFLCFLNFMCVYFTSFKYLPYISLNAISFSPPIKRPHVWHLPTLTGGTNRMTIVSIVSGTSCLSVSFLSQNKEQKIKIFCNLQSFVS